jgi:hypothetical protein
MQRGYEELIGAMASAFYTKWHALQEMDRWTTANKMVAMCDTIFLS